MMQTIPQRPYIQNFLDFTSSFLIKEEVSLDEMLLVEANVNILKERIGLVKRKAIMKTSEDA